MNVNAQAYSNYQRASVETAPGKLLLMLFDGAIKNIDNAKKAIVEKDINTAHNLIIKTEDILLELMASLKTEYEISKNLFNLYEYLYNELIQANAGKDINKLDAVLGFLTDFRDIWEEAGLKAASASRAKYGNGLKQALNIKG